MKIQFITILLLALLGCKKEEIMPNYAGPAFLHLDSIASIPLEEFISTEEKVILSAGWYFHGYDQNPGIQASFPARSDSILVPLPHRLPEANSNLWYSAGISLPEGYLWVGADDGAQVWLDGKSITPNENLFFRIPKTEDSRLLVRVINNAASGGLRKVYWIRRAVWEDYQGKYENVLSERLAEAKRQLWVGDSSQSEGFPIWYSEPTALAYRGDSLKLVWVAEVNQKATLHFGHAPHMILQSVPAISEEGIYSTIVSAKMCSYFFFEIGKTTSPIYSLKTPAVDREQTSFAVWADSQSGWETFSKTLWAIEATNPEFSIGIGDLVSEAGKRWEYVRLLQSLHGLGIPHFLFPGNHDYDHAYHGDSKRHWQAQSFRTYLKDSKTNNYQAWTSGPCAFIALDPNENFPVGIQAASAQWEWFEAAIQSDSWKVAPWKIILVHQPPFSQGWPGYQGEKTIENLLKPYWEKGLIDLVISGHTHDYERLLLSHRAGKTAFLILGGAGGNLESSNTLESVPNMDKVIRTHHFGKIDADKNRLIFRAIDLEGKVIDSLQFKK